MPNEYGKLIRDGVNYSHDTAESISYDNTTSGLSATDAQSAIDELAAIPNGHDIIDDDGTEMTMREGLQFVGSYNIDDSTNDKSVVNVVRTMTEAQRSQLSQAQQKGFIYTTDTEEMLLDADNVVYGDGSVKDALDELEDATTGLATFNCDIAEGGYCTYVKKGKYVFVAYNFSISSAVTNVQNIIEGLPKAALYPGQFNFVQIANDSDGTTKRALLENDSNYLNIRNYYGRVLVQDGMYVGSFSYIAQ